MQKALTVVILLVALVLTLEWASVQTAQAEEAVCGQWVRAYCPFAGEIPVFVPCGTNQVWVYDAITFDFSLIQIDQFARLYSPRVSYEEGFSCDGYSSTGYLWTVARSEPISSCSACLPAQNNPPSGYTLCASEGQRCNFDGTKDVAYGANGQFNYKYGVTGGVDCNNATFGDPISGVGKACYIKVAAPTPTPPVPQPPPTPVQTVQSPPPLTEAPKVLIVKNVNLRDGPSTANYHVVGSARPGQEFFIVGKDPSGKWWQICCDSQRRLVWVAGWLVKTSGQISNVKVVEIVPATPQVLPRPVPGATPIPISPTPVKEELKPDRPCDTSSAIFLKPPVSCEWSLVDSVTKVALNPACIELGDNPLGYFTLHTIYGGWIFTGADGLKMYGWFNGKNGVAIGPALIVTKFEYLVCGIPD